MPLLPETALPGGFSPVINHVISEIADCTQRQKTEVPTAPFPAVPAHWDTFAMALIKMDSLARTFSPLAIPPPTC